MKKLIIAVILAAFSYGASADEPKSYVSSIWADLVQQINSVTGNGGEPTTGADGGGQSVDSVTGNGGRPSSDTRSVTGNGG